MRKIAYILSCCLLGLTTTSCFHKLSKGYSEYIPYRGDEILIFQSDLNRMDTIFLAGIDNYKISGKTLDIYQATRVVCTKTDPNYDRYLDQQTLLKIMAAQKGISQMFFSISLKDATFYNLDYCNLTEFENMPDTELTIGDKTYNDVKVFEADEFAKYYENRDNYAERFYWSFSEGFLGLDKKDEKWRLIKKLSSL